MILYCVVCYLIMFGILLDQHQSFETFKYEDFILSLFAPIIVPIIFGMHINDKRDEQ